MNAEPSIERVQDLSQFRMPPGFRGRSAFVVQLWWIVEALLFRPSPQFLFGWRRSLLRLFGAQIGRGVLVRPTVRTTYPWKVTIGDYSWIGDSVELYSLGPIEIGAHAVISQHCYLCTGSHDYHRISFDIYERAIKVEDECWLAAGVFVYPGVTIGRGSVVGARSIVRQDTVPYSVNVGSPAVRIGSRQSRSG
jgi:putative colanic acid biosynthesis acetyltransferase WcaF